MRYSRLPLPAVFLFSIAALAQTAQTGKKSPVVAKPAPSPAMPTMHFANAQGDFEPYKSETMVQLKPMLLAGDGTVLASPESPVADTTLRAWVLNNLQLQVVYSLKVGSGSPAMIALHDSAGVPRLFPLVIGKVAEAYSSHRVMISGDFCQALQPTTHQPCLSGLLAMSDDSPRPGTTGVLYSTDGITSVTATVEEIGQSWVRLTFVSDPSFQPHTLALSGSKGARTFVYKAAAPDLVSDAVYRASDLDLICPGRKIQGVPEAITPCVADMATITASPSSGIQVGLVSNDGDLLFTRVISSGGILPEVLTIHDKDNRHTVIARRLTTPSTEQALLIVNMTILDQETVHRNYGPNIAGHYLAVQLDVVNRTAKKLQFNKSAIWFDVDFKESKGPSSVFRTYDILSRATLDAVPAHVYNAPFVTDDTTCRLVLGKVCIKKSTKVLPTYRFGIEQNDRMYPDGYRNILSAFDFAVEKSNRLFDYVQLFGGVLTTVATGGSVAQIHNFAFRDSANVLTGVFLPGFRSTTLDVAGTNRLRENLVEQTMQDIVPVAPNGFSSTIVLLPRDGILGVAGYKTSVVIDRILNVHIDPDVLNGVKDPPVAANHVELGYTKDQVRQSLGDAPGVTTDTSGVSVFSYTTGAYLTVTFDKTGKVMSYSQRSVADQMTGARTLSDARAILMANALSSKVLTLVNKHLLLVDIVGVTKIPEFDENGLRVGDYTLIYDQLTTLATVGTTKIAFEAARKKLIPSGATLPEPATQGTKNQATWTYPMPDVQGGSIVATFVATPVADTTKIKTIVFQGEKP